MDRTNTEKLSSWIEGGVARRRQRERRRFAAPGLEGAEDVLPGCWTVRRGGRREKIAKMRCHRCLKSRAAERWGSFLDITEGLEYLLVLPVRLTGHTHRPWQVDEEKVTLRLSCGCSHDIFPAS